MELDLKLELNYCISGLDFYEKKSSMNMKDIFGDEHQSTNYKMLTNFGEITDSQNTISLEEFENNFINNSLDVIENRDNYDGGLYSYKEPIFEIIKEEKSEKTENKSTTKKGRRKKDAPLSYKLKHTKDHKDNVIIKIKNHFVESVFNYINKKYKDFIKTQKKNYLHPLLKRISNHKYKVYSKKKNREFFSLSLRELFSSELKPKRYTNFLKDNSKNYNRDNIDLLINENEATELIEIFNMTVEEMYEKYITNEIPECNLRKNLIKLKEKNKIGDIKKYEEVAKNLIIDIKKRYNRIKSQ